MRCDAGLPASSLGPCVADLGEVELLQLLCAQHDGAVEGDDTVVSSEPLMPPQLASFSEAGLGQCQILI